MAPSPLPVFNEIMKARVNISEKKKIGPFEEDWIVFWEGWRTF